jgi:DNA invertase Pin-like site-specific DNA recombinase
MEFSTIDPNTARQLDALPLDRTFTDNVSGKDIARPQFIEMLKFVRAGDTVMVHSMDRLARNLGDLRTVVLDLTDRGVQVQFIKESLTFNGDDSAMSVLLLNVMGAFAEFERVLTRIPINSCTRAISGNTVLTSGCGVARELEQNFPLSL